MNEVDFQPSAHATFICDVTYKRVSIGYLREGEKGKIAFFPIATHGLPAEVLDVISARIRTIEANIQKLSV